MRLFSTLIYIETMSLSIRQKGESQKGGNNGFTGIFIFIFHKNTNILNNRVYIYHFKVEVFLVFTGESGLVG